MEKIHFERMEEFEDYLLNSPVYADRLRFENELMASSQQQDSFKLDCFCVACEAESALLVDKLFGSVQNESGWLPNWRERLECPSCRLNNRQRAMIHVVKNAVAGRNGEKGKLSLYATEQITPFYAWLEANLAIECVGSEYLGEDLKSSYLADKAKSRIHHENVEALSFEAGQFDFIVSNDVMEHVNQPRLAITEMMRVLKPGGEVFMSVPFCPGGFDSVRRAELVDNRLEHYLPEQYHGNPLSPDGSLVFHDFGWDLLDWFRDDGFGRSG